MFTDEQRKTVSNVLDKKRQDPLYRPLPEEQIVIDAVLEARAVPRKSLKSVANQGTLVEH
jgi:hypothetical protein